MKQLIFLDIDGVLNSTDFYSSETHLEEDDLDLDKNAVYLRQLK